MLKDYIVRATAQFKSLKNSLAIAYTPSRYNKVVGAESKEALESRALFVHSFLTVTRLIMMIVGVAAWQRALDNIDAN